MQIGKSIAYLAYGGAVAVAAFAALTSNHPIVQTLLVLAAAGCGFAGVRLHIAHIRLEQKALADAEAERSEQFLLQTVNRMRHDLMNDLQVLFGYIQLKKYDKLPHTVENIKAKLLHESYVSRLGISALIAYFITVRCSIMEFELEVELEEELNLAKLPLEPESITVLTREMIGLFQKSARTDAAAVTPNVLSLQFAEEEDALLLDFMYRGVYDRGSLERKIEELLHSTGSSVSADELLFHEQEAAVTLKMPFHT